MIAYYRPSICAFRIEDDLICVACLTEKEHEKAEYDPSLTFHEMPDDKEYFCARCNKKIEK